MTICKIYLIFFFLLFSNLTLSTPNAHRIIVALSQKPFTLDPRWATDAMGMRLSQLLFQSLVRLDKNLKVQPSLATSWSFDRNIYTFYVPQGVRFSNGRKLIKEDIQFSFDQYRSNQSPFSSAFKIIKDVTIKETPKQFEVVVSLSRYSATFLSSDMPLLKILPKKEILSNEKAFRKNPIGSGNFVLIKHDDNQIHLRQRNSQKEVVFQVIRDDLTRYQKVLRKEVDIVQNELSYLHVDQLVKDSKIPYQFFENEGLSMNYLVFNLKDGLFRNKQAREAVALALDRKNLIQYKFKNYVSPAVTILSPQSVFFNSSLVPRSHNIEKSKQILKQNGWDDKKIILKTSNNRQVISYARLLAYQLRQLGWSVELKSYEWGTFYGDVNKGRFQVALLRWVGAFDPDIYRVAFHSAEKPPHGRNRGFYSNKELDTLLEQGHVEKDLNKRIQIYYKVQHIIHRDLPIVPLWHNKQLSLVKHGIKGYFLPMNGSYDYLDRIEKEF